MYDLPCCCLLDKPIGCAISSALIQRIRRRILEDYLANQYICWHRLTTTKDQYKEHNPVHEGKMLGSSHLFIGISILGWLSSCLALVTTSAIWKWRGEDNAEDNKLMGGISS